MSLPFLCCIVLVRLRFFSPVVLSPQLVRLWGDKATYWLPTEFSNYVHLVVKFSELADGGEIRVRMRMWMWRWCRKGLWKRGSVANRISQSVLSQREAIDEGNSSVHAWNTPPTLALMYINTYVRTYRWTIYGIRSMLWSLWRRKRNCDGRWALKFGLAYRTTNNHDWLPDLALLAQRWMEMWIF